MTCAEGKSYKQFVYKLTSFNIINTKQHDITQHNTIIERFIKINNA